MFKPIWPILFCGLVVALALYIAYENYPWWHHGQYDETFDKWFTLFFGTFITVVVAFGALGAGCGLAAIIGGRIDQDWHRCWRGAMVSMRSAEGVSGSIMGGVFMISGHIDSEQIYYYYTLNKDGSFQPHKWKADKDTSIFEEDRKDGEVIQFDEKFVNPLMGWIGFEGDRLRMEFHIPKGSLRQKFELK